MKLIKTINFPDKYFFTNLIKKHVTNITREYTETYVFEWDNLDWSLILTYCDEVCPKGIEVIEKQINSNGLLVLLSHGLVCDGVKDVQIIGKYKDYQIVDKK